MKFEIGDIVYYVPSESKNKNPYQLARWKITRVESNHVHMIEWLNHEGNRTTSKFNSPFKYEYLNCIFLDKEYLWNKEISSILSEE